MDKGQTRNLICQINLHLIIGFFPCSLIAARLSVCLFYRSQGILIYLDIHIQQDITALKYPKSDSADLETTVDCVPFGSGFFVYFWFFDHKQLHYSTLRKLIN
jgi:hypothetical protein